MFIRYVVVTILQCFQILSRNVSSCICFISDATTGCCFQDVDEFFWAPSHRRLADYLAAQPDDVSEIIALVRSMWREGRFSCCAVPCAPSQPSLRADQGNHDL